MVTLGAVMRFWFRCRRTDRHMCDQGFVAGTRAYNRAMRKQNNR